MYSSNIEVDNKPDRELLLELVYTSNNTNLLLSRYMPIIEELNNRLTSLETSHTENINKHSNTNSTSSSSSSTNMAKYIIDIITQIMTEKGKTKVLLSVLIVYFVGNGLALTLYLLLRGLLEKWGINI